VLDDFVRERLFFSIRNTIISGSLLVSISISLSKEEKAPVVEFRDLRGVFRGGSLNSIAKDVLNEQKLDMDVKNLGEITEELIHYNKQDVVLLEKLYSYTKNFFNDERILTSAGLSFRYYLNRYRPDLKRTCSRRGVRESYYGGRVEVFKFYGKDVACYDVNSMYPFVMKNFPYPIGELYHEKNLNKEGFSRAKVKIPDVYIPLLPFKLRHKLMFIKGEAEGCWTNFELRKAKSLGYDVELLDGYVCDDTDYIFDNFIKDVYAKRLEAKKNGNKSLDYMYKLIMNSVYGKFGSRSETERIVMNRIERIKNGEELLKKFVFDDGVYAMVKYKVANTSYYDYVIASYITSYARCVLFDYLHKVENNVLYCDTDSLFVENDNTLENYVGDELGQLKREYSANLGKFLLPKVYAVQTDKKIVKAKGVMVNRSNFDRIFDCIMGARTIEVEQPRTLGLKESFRRKFDNFFNYLKPEENKKVIEFKYDKRKPIDDRNTIPYDAAEVNSIDMLTR